MKRGLRSTLLAIIPFSLAVASFLALAAGVPAQEAPPEWAPPCTTGGQKWADPQSVRLGDQTKITMVMTATCPSYALPMDIVFVFDRSNSMTRGDDNPGNIGGTGTPGNTVPGTAQPTGDPGGTFPTQEKPPPTRPVDPPIPTALSREAAAPRADARVHGLAQVKPPTEDPRVTPPDDEEKRTATPPSGNVGTPPPGNLPTPSDLILRDQEEPAGTEDLIREVQQAIMDFMDHFEADANAGRVRFALVSFNDRARIDVDLSPTDDGFSRVRSRLSRMRGEGNTRIDLGLSTAARVLYGVSYRGRTDLDHKKVVILFSDGIVDRRTTARLRTRDDVTYLSVAAGRAANRQVMNNLASEREFALDIRDRQELQERVAGLVPNTRDVTMHTVTIFEKLKEGMQYVPDSAVPPVTRVLDDGTLEWDFLDPTSPMTVTYEVEPGSVGVLPLSEGDGARWADSAERLGTTEFPEVELDVSTFVPTSTPTVEVTVTTTPIEPTDTPQAVRPAFLPYLANRFPSCEPQNQTVDVALVVDTSISMSDSTSLNGVRKIDAAVAAGMRFVSLLKPGDQATVISFNEHATVLAPLTNDRPALEAAMQQLRSVQAQGTRINTGLDAALAELESGRHRAANTRAIILVTDGRQQETVGPEAVRASAAAVGSAGIVLWTVGLGQDADQDLLREIATTPSTYLYADAAEDLELIYEDIARLVPCP